MYLFHPQIQKTIDLIKEGEIGEILSMETYFGNNILTKKNWFGLVKEKRIDPTKRIFNKEMGGGAILDAGCYPLTMAKLIAGHIQGLHFAEPKNFSATGQIDKTGVDLQSHAKLFFSESKVGVINLKINSLSLDIYLICIL